METELASSDVEMSDSGSVEKKKLDKVGGSKIKKKKIPGAKNIKVRKYVKPKNAVMCLNDLKSGLVYATEQEGSVGTPFCITVMVDGKTYRGYGSSKQLAKQAAAEAALISFVQPPVSTGDTTNDKTPWVTLASFAIYKLFKEWREKPVGVPNPSTIPFVPGSTSSPLSINPSKLLLPSSPVIGQGKPSLQDIKNQLNASNNSVPMAINDGTSSSPDSQRQPNPAKKVPANANNMHPVMVLHQMRPGLTYEVNQTTQDNQRFFHMSVIVDGQTFYGEGPTMKKAKFCLARDAIKVLFDIESMFECPP